MKKLLSIWQLSAEKSDTWYVFSLEPRTQVIATEIEIVTILKNGGRFYLYVFSVMTHLKTKIFCEKF